MTQRSGESGGRGRGRSRSEATRGELMDAALTLFAEQGFAGTSIRQIAKTAGTNLASVSYHFGDKNGLYTAVLGRLYDDMRQQAVQSLVEGTVHSWADLAHVLWSFARRNRQHILLAHRHLLDHGQQHARVGEWVEPVVLTAEAFVLAHRPAWTTVRARMTLMAIVHLLVRFVLDDRERVATLAGGRSDDWDAMVEGWFTDFLQDLLGTWDPDWADRAS